MILEDRARRNIRKLESLYTQEQIAAFAGVSRVQINRIVNGDVSPKLGTLEHLALALHLEPGALLESAVNFDAILEKVSVSCS